MADDTDGTEEGTGAEKGIGNTIKEVVGKVTEKLGWATGDRAEEAKGKLRQADAEGIPSEDGSVAADSDDAAADAVLEAEREVRSDHGELAPEAEPD